ncbi:MAG TPA: phenylalanine--tRNA ligase subunit alpha [Gemmatimonadaceae bacterium]|jgi:phenylalanyl-tRNA synthetase alpha chain|nr:phenylalanine--tRNA ligase subunit alpha [Gemmatimonadaceae bacterium]
MNLDQYLAEAEAIEREGAAALNAATDVDALETARVAFLGDRQGRVKALQESLKSISKEDKPAAGKRFNEARTRLQSLHDERKTALGRARGAGAKDDLSLPERRTWKGAKHPVTLVIEEIEGIFRELGFTVAQGPEAETEWYNFGALNFPPNHPALDAHDTLYLEGGGLLRTHTSPVQIRTLQRYAPPIRVLIPGTVYRRDFFDASHAPAFAQIEGLCVDEGISFVDLKSTLNHFAERFFGASRTRFRPSFFPFTEPSAEMDVQCGICGGSGCPACKGTGWIEILGSGMVHPAVLEAAGLDSERYTGWAFGMGPARIAISRHGIPDIRILYDSDVRFLEQIAGPVLSGAEG